MKLSINLLPIEFTQAEFKRAKFYKVQAIGVSVILSMVFLSSLSVALRILQSQNIKGVQSQVSASEQKVSDRKDIQASLLLLKNRLAVINQYLNSSSKQTQMYQLLDKLIPQSVLINSISFDKVAEVTILAQVPDSQTLDLLVDNLTNESSNDKRINQVSIDTISRGRDGAYRISMKIKPK